jgi:hypothetical protein
MRLRHVGAAFAAGIASLAIPVAGWLVQFMKGSAGDQDDAPFRASAVLLILSPVLVLVCSAWFMVSTWALRRLGRLTLRALLGVSCVVCLLSGALFAVQDFGVGSLGDAAISFATFGFGACACLAVGSWVWWLLRSAA